MFDRHAKPAFVLVVILLTAGTIGFRSAVSGLNVYLDKKPVALRSQLDNIQTSLEDWVMTVEAPKLTAEMVEELGTPYYLDRQYHLEGGGREAWLNLHLAYYTGMIDAVPHVPDRCFVAGGFNARSRPSNLPLSVSRERWRERGPTSGGEPYWTVTYLDGFTRSPLTVRMPEGAFALRTTEFSSDDQPDRRIYAGYFFIANGRVAVTPEDVKSIAFRKSEEYAYYCKVQLTAYGGRDFTTEAFVDRSADFVEALLPELMRCLPAWEDIQTGATSEPDADEARGT